MRRDLVTIALALLAATLGALAALDWLGYGLHALSWAHGS